MYIFDRFSIFAYRFTLLFFITITCPKQIVICSSL